MIVLRWLLLLGLLAVPLYGAHQRMTVTFRYKGEVLKATFFTTTRNVCENVEDAEDRLKATSYLDDLRFDYYTGRDPEMTQGEKNDLRQSFFNWERLRFHDEIMVIHRGEAAKVIDPRNPVPLGIGKDIVAMIAVDRLGHTMLDCLPGFDSLQYERLLLEHRLNPLGLLVARPTPSIFLGTEIPKGVFKHWDPYIAKTYFNPGSIVFGDVIQANALFAHEGTWPLVHSLANGYGLFSTGRIIPSGKEKQIGIFTWAGPRVFIPSLVVWEVFNKEKDGVIRKAARTKYYEGSGAVALKLDGRDQWKDPRLLYGNHVQIMSKTGDQFRGGWTEHFARHDNFDFVRDVRVISTEFESMDGTKLVAAAVPQWAAEIDHHPHGLDSCIHHMLNPTPVQQWILPIEVSVSIGPPVLQINPPNKK